MRVQIGAALGVVFAGMALVAWTPARDPMTLLPASKLWVEGKSTVRDWKCNAVTIQGAVDARGEEPVQRVVSGEKVVESVIVTVPIEKMDCGNGTMNEHMRKALKSEANPNIVFTLGGYELKTTDGVMKALLNGTLRIGGAERQVSIETELSASPDGILKVKGTHTFAMTQFGLKPPSLMLGAMKVKDQVVVGFDLQLNK
jgi:polyisoprenoid-binding protein YceI